MNTRIRTITTALVTRIIRPAAAPCLAIALLATAVPITTLAADEPPLPVLRFEQMLLRSPAPGRAFDEVFIHYSTHHSANDLAARWLQQIEDTPADEPQQAFPYHMALALLQQRLGDYEAAREQLSLAAAAQPDSFRPHFQAGRIDMLTGRFADAITALSRAIDLPIPPTDSREVYGELARAQQRMRDLDGAVATWRALAEALPGDPFVLEEVGQALLEADRYDDARETFELMAAAAQGDPYRELLAQLKLAEVKERQRQTEAAIEKYAATLARTHPDSWLNREIAARIQSIFRRNNNIDGLIQFYQQRRSDFPADLRSARTLAALYRETKKNEEALALLAELTAQAPNEFDLHHEYTLLLINEGQLDTALPLLEALVERQPRRWAFRESLGELYLRQARADNSDDHSRTLETWAALVPSEAPNVSQLLQLADLYRLHGFEQQAIDTYAAALSLDPDAYDLRERYAAYLFSLEQDDNAWAVLRNDGQPLSSADHYLRLARVEHRRNLNEAALLSVANGLAIEPDHFRLLELQWQIHARDANWQACLNLYPQLIELAPNQQTANHIDQRQVIVLRSTNQLDAHFDALAEKFHTGQELSDNQLRLLSRLALNVNKPESGQLIEAIISQNPDSLPIALIAVEYWNSANDHSQHVAALRRLIQLSPERQAEWLRAIVRAQQTAQQIDDARETFAALAALYPDDPATYLLEADIAYQADEPEVGNRALRRAIRLSDEPNAIRNRLASRLQAQGNFDEVLTLREEAFAAAESLTSQLSLVRTLAEAALQANVFDLYAEKFLTRDTGLRETLNFHLLRGEMYFTARDLTRASEEWRRAHAMDPTDPLLLGRLSELAQLQGDTIARVEIARDLFRAAPTPDNALTLGKALIDNGELEEGLQFLGATSGTILDDQNLVIEVVSSAVRQMAADDLITILKREQAHSGDPSRQHGVVLAEAMIAAGYDAEATEILWDIFTTPDPENGNSLRHQARSLPFHSYFIQSHQPFQRFTQLTQNRNPMSGTSYFHTSHSPSPQHTLQRSRLNSLVYLARLAMVDNSEDAFVKKLNDYLRQTGASREHALEVFSTIGDRDEVARIAVEFFDEDDNLETLMLAHAALARQRHRFFHYSGGHVPTEPEDPYSDLAAEIRRRIIDSKSPLGYELMLFEAQHLADKGDTQAARAMLEQLSTKLGRSSLARNLQPQIIQVAIAAAFANKDARMVLDFLQRFRDDNRRHFGSSPAMITLQFLAEFGEQPLTDEDWQLLVDLLIDDQLAMRSVVRTTSSHSQLHAVLSPPIGTQGVQQHMAHQIRQHFPQFNPEVRQRLIGYLQQHAQQTEGVQPVTLNLLFLFHLMNNDHEEAIAAARELLDAEPDDALRYNLANLLIEMKRFDAAITELNSIQVHAGDLFIATQIKLIEAARAADDSDQAIRAAERLLRTPVPQHISNFNFSQVLTSLGMADRIPQIQIAQQQHHVHPAQQQHNLVNAMNNELNRAHNAVPEVQERVARNVLQLLSIADTNSRRPRDRALKMLNDSGSIDRYIEELQLLTTNNPSSLRLQVQLAEALQAKGDHNASLALIRPLLEQRPHDGVLAQMLARILVDNKDVDALIAHFDAYPGDSLIQQLNTSGLHSHPHSQDGRHPGRTGIVAVYLDADKADELVRHVTNLIEDQQSRMSIDNTGLDHNTRSRVMSLANTLHAEGMHQKAVNLWDSVFSMETNINPTQYQHVFAGLLGSHQAVGMSNDELAERLLLIFTPGDVTHLPPPSRFFSLHLSRSHPHQFHNHFASTFSRGHSRMGNNAITGLDLVEDPEILQTLLQRLEINTSDPRYAANLRTLSIYLRSRLLDLTLDDEMEEFFTVITQGNTRRQGMQISHSVPTLHHQALQIILDSMINWPDIGERILDDYIAGNFDQQGPFHFSNNNSQILANNHRKITMAHLAAVRGDLEQARKWLDQMEPYPIDPSITNNLSNMTATHRAHLETLLLLNEEQAANEMVETLITAVAQRIQHNRPMQQLQEFNGWTTSTEPAEKMDANIWPVPSADPDGTLLMAWEIRPSSSLPVQRRGRQQTSPPPAPTSAFGLPLPEVDGGYQLRIDWLQQPEAEPTESTTLGPVDARGSLALTPPLPGGFLKATLLLDGEPVAGEAAPTVPFSSAPNLLPNPDLNAQPSADGKVLTIPGWHPPTVVPATLLTGPTHGGTHLFASPPFADRQITLRSEPIPISADQSYLISGWIEQLVQSHQAANNQIILRFLDADNHPIGKPITMSNPQPDMRWIRHYKILTPSDSDLPHSVTIPQGTTAVDIQLNGSNLVRFAEIALQPYNAN